MFEGSRGGTGGKNSEAVQQNRGKNRRHHQIEMQKQSLVTGRVIHGREEASESR